MRGEFVPLFSVTVPSQSVSLSYLVLFSFPFPFRLKFCKTFRDIWAYGSGLEIFFFLCVFRNLPPGEVVLAEDYVEGGRVLSEGILVRKTGSERSVTRY